MMKYSEIDQRELPNNSLMIQCNCGMRFDHFMVIEYHSWEYDTDERYKSMTVTLALPTHGFWGRLVRGVRYIFGYETNCFYDIGITRQDIEQIQNIFQEYLVLSEQDQNEQIEQIEQDGV
jgi:hypothetical protein